MINNHIPYGRQSIEEEDIQAVIKVLRSPLITQGPVVEKFEEAIAKKVDAKYGVAVNSATSALHIACLSLGIGQGDWVWTSPITFVASANCAMYTGAQIDFVDINEYGLMSIEKLRTKLKIAKKEKRIPKLVIPVHLGGASCNMLEIKKLSKEYGFAIIEDASHAIGGEYEGEKIGCCEYSDITVFSFHPVKIITTGEGGIATTNNTKLKNRMIRLRSHGITKEENEIEKKKQPGWYYEQQELGYNYRMTDIQAALGLSQLTRLEEIVKERNRQALYYTNQLQNIIQLNKIPDNCISAYHLYIVKPNAKQEQVYKILKNSGITTQLHYLPVHLHPYYRKMGFREGDFEEAEKYATTSLSIPIYPGLTRKEQDKIITNLKKALL